MRVALIGAGNMGGAMLRGWIAKGLGDIQVVDPNIAPDLRSQTLAAGGRVHDDLKSLEPADIIVVAVKPQGIGPLLDELAQVQRAGFALMSVAAGTSQATLATPFAVGLAIVRAMPNTPALVGRGVTVCHANAAVDDELRMQVNDLLTTVGCVEWVDDEAKMDAVTGLSGSGPAYVYHMVEAMAEAGVAAGLEADLAMRLARATVSGAGEMLHDAVDDVAILRERVTSPGGTTAAGLAVLMADDGLSPLMKRAVAAAARRSKELGA